ncbi:MAG: protein phosphatase 2C domain-containing protein [Planctomycetota bacterium]|nr:protein phosphatase 2C domain-containing protein [Planctomycetota bacterium]
MSTDPPPHPEFFLDADTQAPAVRELAGGRAAVWSSRGDGPEIPNEDAAMLLPLDAERAVIALADGFGGQPQGEKASRLTLETLAKVIRSACAEGSELRDAILNGFEQANAAVRQLANGAASTLAVVEIQGRVARPYHVGDTEILAVGQRGRVKLRTVSHSPTGYAVESGLMDEKEALHHEERHIVSNMIGLEEMRIEVGAALELAERDTVLLASDGLWDNLHSDEIVARLRRFPLERAVADLAQASRARMENPRDGKPSKPDDLTLVAYRPRGGKARGA